MKKILFIINSLKCGGAERLLLDILRNFDYTHYDVSLLTFNDICMFEDTLPPDVKRLNCIGFGARVGHWHRKILNAIGCLDKYYQSQIKHVTSGYDTIISFLEGFPLRAHSYITDNSKRNLSFVHTDLSVYPDSIAQFGGLSNMIEAYKKMSEVVFVSEGALKGFDTVCGDILEHKQILHNFIDVESIERKAKLSESPYDDQFFNVVLLGRVTEVKGYDVIPEVARMIKTDSLPIRFTIVGDGGYMPILMQQLKETDTEDIVFLAGFQSNPYPYVKNANLLLSTSKTEGLPISFCEAMAFGVPIMATPTAGAMELLSDSTGIIVKRDVQSIYKEIVNVFQEKKKLSKLSEKSKEKAKEFGKMSYLERLYAIL